MKKKTPEVSDLTLAEEMSFYIDDPLGFVLRCFPWDTDASLQVVELPEPWRSKYNQKYGPDKWACEFLTEVGLEVMERAFDGKKAVDPLCASVSSGHGIGKSAMVGWVVCWIMSTRPYAQGTVTANTATQLTTKTWAQITKWFKLCVTRHWFEINSGRGSMNIKHMDHPETWFCSGQTCKEENSESFAGQHAANSTSFYVFDEASSIHEKIWEVSKGGLTDGEPMHFVFGNPTQNRGSFFETHNRQKHRWPIRYKIDSRTVQITNKKYLAGLIADHGIESDIVKVRVLGDFPASSVNQLIGRGIAEAAAKKKLHISAYDFAPVVLACDPAWDGGDRTTIVMRQGLHSRILYEKVTERGKANDMHIGALLVSYAKSLEADMIFVDMGWGSGIVSYLKTMNIAHMGVYFNSSPVNEAEYTNLRTEMWVKMNDWLMEGGQLPPNDDLVDDLTGPDVYWMTNGKKRLESKDEMKVRGLRSPDLGDGLALTFAADVKRLTPLQKAQARFGTGKINRVETEESPV